MRVALIPPDVVLTNKGPYLVWPKGDASDQAYLLGVLCSLPLDWYARRFRRDQPELSHLQCLSRNPMPERSDPIRAMVVDIAGRLLP